MVDLIVDFPLQRNHHLAVRFADNMVQQHIVERHEDYDTENTVARHELWYTKAEYHAMRLAIKKDVLEVRSNAAEVAHSIIRATMIPQASRSAFAVLGSSISSHRLVY